MRVFVQYLVFREETIKPCRICLFLGTHISYHYKEGKGRENEGKGRENEGKERENVRSEGLLLVSLIRWEVFFLFTFSS